MYISNTEITTSIGTGLNCYRQIDFSCCCLFHHLVHKKSRQLAQLAI